MSPWRATATDQQTTYVNNRGGNNPHADPELYYVKQNRIGQLIGWGGRPSVKADMKGKGSFGEVYKGCVTYRENDHRLC